MSERSPSGKEPFPDHDDLRVLGEMLEANADTILERWCERTAAEHPRFEDHQREEILNALHLMIREFGLRLRQEDVVRLWRQLGITATSAPSSAGPIRT